MQTRPALLKGGDSGKPDKSLLFYALQSDADPHMPPKKQLSTNQIEIVRRWIAEDVKWDEAALRGEKRVREVKLESLPASRAPVVTLALAPDGRLLATGQALDIHDAVKSYATLSNVTVTMTGRAELRVTGTNDPLPGCVIHLNSPDAWLLLPAIFVHASGPA